MLALLLALPATLLSQVAWLDALVSGTGALAARFGATNLLGAVTLVVAVVFSVPQWWRIRRHGTASGMSVTALANSSVSTTAWVGYGISLGDWWVALTALAAAPALAATIVAARRAGARLEDWRVPVTWSIVLVGLAATHAPLFPVVLGCSILWYVTPAVVTAWRAHDVSGISAGTWLLLILDGVLAGSYGLVAEVPANVMYAVAAILGSAAVLARLGRDRRRATARLVV